MLIFAFKNFVVAHGLNPHPLWTIANFHEKKFYDWMCDHEIQENIVPKRKWSFTVHVPKNAEMHVCNACPAILLTNITNY